MTATKTLPEDISGIEIPDKKRRILHLEDLPSDALLIDKALKKGNVDYERLVVDTKDKFIKALNDFSPDIILADHSLPSFNSLDALVIFHETGMKIPFILVTATISEEFAVEILKKGADDYILKDRLHRLPTAIQNALEKYRLKRAKEVIIDELIINQSHLIEVQAIAKVGSWKTDLQNFNVIWSEETHHIFETDPKKFQATHEAFLNFIHPDERNHVNTAFENSLNSQTVNSIEHRIITTNGMVKHVIENWKIFQDAQGHPVRAIGTCQDITERKLTEIDLLESREEMQTVFNASLDAIIIIDEEGKITKWDSKAELLFGWKEEEVIGTLLSDNIIPPRLREAHKQGMKHFLKTGKGPILNKTIEVHALKKDKTEINISLSISPIRAKNKYRFIGFIRDISERKVVEEALQKSESNLKAIFENTSDGFILTDINGIIKSFNSKARDRIRLNIEKEINIGKSIFDFLPDSRKKMYKDNILKVLSGKILQYDYPYTRKSGETKWFSFTINPVYNAEKIEGICITSTDITERKIAENKLNATSEELRTTSERLLLATTSAKMGIWDWDVVNNNLIWDKTMYSIFGVAEDKFSGAYEAWAATVHPDDIERASKDVNDAITGIRDFNSEFRIIWPDKSVHFIEAHAIVSRDEAGVGVRMIGVNIDITERKKADEKLIQSEKHSRNLFEQTVIGLALARMDGTLADVNEAFAKIIGRTIEETLKLTYWEITPEKYHDQENKVLEELMGTGKFINYEKEYIHKNGNLVPVRLSGNIFEKDGEKFIWSSVEDITELKKADEENRFKAHLLSTIGQAAIATDIKGIINYWNQAAEDIYGWTKEEAIGKNIIDLTPSESTIEQAIQIMEELKKGQTWSGEFKVRKKDGTNFPALVTNSPIYDQHNKLSGIIGISSDITESKKAEERLVESEAKLKTAQSIAQVGSWEVNLLNYKHSWSDEFCRIFGVECDEIIPSSEAFLSFVHPHDAALVISSMENAFATFTNSSFSFQFIKKNGELRHATTEWKFEFDHNDKPIRIDGILRDITQQTKLENETLKVYKEKNSILESIGDGFYALDKNWNFTYWNKEAERLLNKKREEVLGKNIWEIFPDSIDSEMYKKYHEAIEKNAVINFEVYHPAIDKWFEVSAYPSSTGLSVFFKDITDRKISEKQLGELNANLKKHASDLAISNKELEEFAYVASHDLQEPLRMVTGFLGQIENKYSDLIDDKGKQYIHFAMDGAKRMRQIILDLLEFSRIGRIEDTENLIDLNDIVREVIVLCQKQVTETKAIIRFENLPSLVTHQTSLRQVFQNLISNSLKYHTKGIAPLIIISAEETETHWQFAISDNGIGIEEEYFNKIFVIFQRLHNKDEYSGTGIGLAVCKKIIENLGGKVWLTSVPEKGTTFYFTIPKK